MYDVDGISLTGSEYRKLALLVECKRAGGDVKACASEANASEDLDAAQNNEILRGLMDAGLILGVRASRGVVFRGITQAGFDFVDDFEAMSSQKRERTKEQRAHDWRVSAFGTITGGVLGLFGGALSGWLVSLW